MHQGCKASVEEGAAACRIPIQNDAPVLASEARHNDYDALRRRQSLHRAGEKVKWKGAAFGRIVAPRPAQRFEDNRRRRGAPHIGGACEDSVLDAVV